MEPLYEVTIRTADTTGCRGVSVRASPRTSSEDADSQSCCSPCEADEKKTIKRKRKPTYYARKDELQSLYEESHCLSRQLQEIQARQLLQRRPLVKTAEVNAALWTSIKRNRRTIVAAQSLLDYNRSEYSTRSIGNYINLPTDLLERQQLLHDGQSHKLQDSLEFLLLRSQFLDLRLPTRQVETSMTAEGHHFASLWEVSVFHGSSVSVDQVFDDLVSFMRNHEMGLAVEHRFPRIQYDTAPGDGGIEATQVRTSSVTSGGLVAEENLVVHAQYFPHSDLVNKPHGVLSVDFVETDEAFPYHPEFRIRKDISLSALVIKSSHPREEESHSIALVRWAQVKIHNSPLATSDALKDLCQDVATHYFDDMVQVMRERIAKRQADSANRSK